MRHLCGAVIVLGLVAGQVRAQSNAIAEQLFNEARDLTKAGKWVEACPKFEASMRLDPALGTRLNLATCYEKVGKVASAWALFRESADLATKAGDAKRAEYAQKQAATLEPRLPKLRISAPPHPPADLVVKRDGVVVSATELNLALYVDPGSHEVTASATGFESVTKSISVVESKVETLELPDLVATPVKVETKQEPGEPEEPVDTPAPPPTRKYVAIGVAGAGVIAIGVGLVFGSQAMSADKDARELCGEQLACSAENFDKGKQLVADGRSKATLSTVFVIGGAAAIAAGAVIFFTAPSAHEQKSSPTARLVPLVDPTTAGLGVVGRF